MPNFGAPKLRFSINQVMLAKAQESTDLILYRFEHPEEILWAVSDAMLEREQQWWKTRGGGRWPKDRPKTIKEKRQHGESVATMKRTGALYKAMTQRSNEYHIERQNLFGELEWGTNLPYARFPAGGGRPALMPRWYIQKQVGATIHRLMNEGLGISPVLM